MRRWTVVMYSIGLVLCAQANAQDKQLYRYTDANGKVVYSDQAPPSNATNVQAKRVTANVIDTSELSLASQRASERFPVTLYTFDCGQPCQGAEALLNKRGVPFTAVNISDQAGSARVTALVGSPVAPVLQIGDKLVSKGLDEGRWQSMLDEAGYPRTPSARRMAPGKGTEAPPVAKASSGPAPGAAPAGGAAPTAGAAPAAETTPAADAGKGPNAPAPTAQSANVPGGGYPK